MPLDPAAQLSNRLKILYTYLSTKFEFRGHTMPSYVAGDNDPELRLRYTALFNSRCGKFSFEILHFNDLPVSSAAIFLKVLTLSGQSLLSVSMSIELAKRKLTALTNSIIGLDIEPELIEKKLIHQFELLPVTDVANHYTEAGGIYGQLLEIENEIVLARFERTELAKKIIYAEAAYAEDQLRESLDYQINALQRRIQLLAEQKSGLVSYKMLHDVREDLALLNKSIESLELSQILGLEKYRGTIGQYLANCG